MSIIVGLSVQEILLVACTSTNNIKVEQSRGSHCFIANRPYRMAQDMLDSHALPTLETHEDNQDSKYTTSFANLGLYDRNFLNVLWCGTSACFSTYENDHGFTEHLTMRT